MPPRESIPAERPRSGGRARRPAVQQEDNALEGVDAIFKTYFTTYTYFTTLEGANGAETVTSRTEVYSNVKSSGVPVAPSEAAENERANSILPSPSSLVAIERTADPSPRRLEYSSIARDVSADPSPRRLEYSSIAKDVSLSRELTTPEPEEATTVEGIDEEDEVVVGVTTEATVTEGPGVDITPTPTLTEDVTTEESEAAATPPLGTTTTEGVTEEAISGTTTEAAVEAVAVDGISPAKTYYTTFTYFTTLFRNGSSYVTSNLETVANTASGTVAPTAVQPSITFFTTFTYWTTSIDGDETVITSSEETKTDVLPASVTDVTPTSVIKASQIRFTERPDVVKPSSTSGVEVQPTAAPELQSSESDQASSDNLISGTPVLESSKQGFEDLDQDFTLVSSVKPSSISRSSKPKAFTPVIRPNLFRDELYKNRSSRKTDSQ